MIELENIEEHLKLISTKDWKVLFDCIPAIKVTKDFGNYINSAEIVNNTMRCIYNLDIVPFFNWVDWVLGRKILTSFSIRNVGQVISNTFRFSTKPNIIFCFYLFC